MPGLWVVRKSDNRAVDWSPDGSIRYDARFHDHVPGEKSAGENARDFKRDAGGAIVKSPLFTAADLAEREVRERPFPLALVRLLAEMRGVTEQQIIDQLKAKL